MSGNGQHVVHIGNGFFIPEKGHTPTKDISHAMVFHNVADSDQWLAENGYLRAIQARQATPNDEILKKPE
jgi:hypothetical protein